MNLAARAVGVGDLHLFTRYLWGIKFDDPILKANCAPEGNNYGVVVWWEPSVSVDVQNGVVKGFGLNAQPFTLMSLYSEQYLQVQELISASVAKVAAHALISLCALEVL